MPTHSPPIEGIPERRPPHAGAIRLTPYAAAVASTMATVARTILERQRSHLRCGSKNVCGMPAIVAVAVIWASFRLVPLVGQRVVSAGRVSQLGFPFPASAFAGQGAV